MKLWTDDDGRRTTESSHPKNFKLGRQIDNRLMFDEIENLAPGSYCSMFLFIFLSLCIFGHKELCHPFSSLGELESLSLVDRKMMSFCSVEKDNVSSSFSIYLFVFLSLHILNIEFFVIVL